MRVRPKLDLAFPAAEVAGIEKTDDGYLVEATFLGLYGPASPLPTFYTEDLLDEHSADSSAGRDLLDLVQHHLYELHDGCSTKYRLNFHLAQAESQEKCLDRLFCLLGLDPVSLRGTFPDPRVLLRYAGILSRHPRSALGLKAFLADALRVPVDVVQGVKRRVPILPEQRLQLGAAHSCLGDDAVLGSEIADCNSMFRVQLGPLDRETFAAFLPGSPRRLLLDSLVEVFLTAPLTWDVELKAGTGEAPAATLGLHGRLGWDAFLDPDRKSPQVTARFPR